MRKIVIAFDVDGTLRCNTVPEERLVANRRIVRLWETLATFKNVELHVWSNRGAEYCDMIVKQFDLQKCKGTHLKQWQAMQQVEVRSASMAGQSYMATRADAFVPDIAIDDQQRFDGGMLNLIVREK